MVAPPLKPRHYAKPAGLVRRSAADVSPAELRARGRRTALTAELLEPRPRRPRLVSTAQGSFTRLLLTVPSYAVESPELAAIYRGLLKELPKATALVVLTHESAAPAVRGWLRKARRRKSDVVVEAPDHLVFSVWAEDGYCATAEGGQTYLVEPYAFPRFGDGLIAELVANATDVRKSQAPLYFPGGNVLVGDDFFLIGADYPAESLDYVGDVLAPAPGESAADLVKRLSREYLDTTRRLIYVGSTVPVPAQRARRVTVDGEAWTEILHAGNNPGTAQPVFHIDMFITLAGRAPGGAYRVLVGDPALAGEILGEPAPAHAMREAFDSIAAGLGRLGFEVVRNPVPRGPGLGGAGLPPPPPGRAQAPAGHDQQRHGGRRRPLPAAGPWPRSGGARRAAVDRAVRSRRAGPGPLPTGGGGVAVAP